MPSSLLIDGRVAFGAFDFDGNILAPDTITYVIDRETGEEVGIAAHTLDQNPELMQTKYRWKDDIIDSLIHFRDYHSDTKHLWPDQFKTDIEEALRRNAYAPSMQKLKEVFLIPARLFAIITARGHSPDNIARIIWILSEKLLTDKEKTEQHSNIESLYRNYTGDMSPLTRDQALRFYFEEIVSYYPVSNPHIAKYLGFPSDMSSSIRKVEAMKHALEDIKTRILKRVRQENTSLAIGFSDDSIKNTLTMIEYFESARSTSRLSVNDTVHIYFTGKQSEAQKFEKPGRNLEQSEDMMIIRI
jgi:hypothetical protein